MNQFGIKWYRWAGPGRLREHEKFFNSADAREKFARKEAERDDFVEFLDWTDPVVTIH